MNQLNESQPKTKNASRLWRRRPLIAALLGLIPAAWLAHRWAWPPLRVTPETTVITSPLLPDGRPDYVAYLNQKYSAGVTPENNAFAIYFRVAGGQAISSETHEPLFRLLGISSPGGAEAWIPWETWAMGRNIPESRLLLLDSKIIKSPGNYLPEHYPEIGEYLAANEAALGLLAEGVRRDKAWLPLWSPSGKGLGDVDVIILLMQQSDWSRLLQLRSLKRLAEENIRGAMEDTVLGVRLGRQLSGQPFLIGKMIGSKLESDGIHACARLLISGRLQIEDVRWLRRELESLPAPADPLELFQFSERFYQLDQIAALRTQPAAAGPVIPYGPAPMSLSLGTDVNEILIRVNTQFDELEQVLRMKDWRERSRRIGEMIERVDAVQPPQPTKFTERVYQWLGKSAPAFVTEGDTFRAFPPSPHFGRSLEISIVRRQLLSAGLAVAEFRAVRGEFPASLSELVPDFLPAPPLDAWRDEPFLYERNAKGFTLLSLGPNGKPELADQANSSSLPGGLDVDDIRFGAQPDEPADPGSLRLPEFPDLPLPE